MWLEFINAVDGQQLKALLYRAGISKKLLAKIKFQGGRLLVNQVAALATDRLAQGDKISVYLPQEQAVSSLIPERYPLEIVFEDAHFLVVNKPAGVASVTGMNHPRHTMSNYVQGYLIAQNYPNQKVHVVTRLDRDTSGLMLFAKHGYAHSLMDKQMQNKQVIKRYYALVAGRLPNPEGEIKAPIGRKPDSIIERMVRADGKYAHTSYRQVDTVDGLTLVDLQLHTGRTHQIRVHMAHLGLPLLGDELYGGNHKLMTRQALHCHYLAFTHPLSQELIRLEAALPQDMADLMKEG